MELILSDKSGDPKGKLADALGIPQERQAMLMRETEIVFHSSAKEGVKVTMSEKMKELCGLCENINEVVWVIFHYGVNMQAARAPQLKIVNVGSAEAFKSMMDKAKEEVEAASKKDIEPKAEG